MRHLDDRLSDLVDGRLENRARERALGHVAHCEHCREQVERERQLRNRLTELRETAPAPSDALQQRLLGIASPQGALPPPRKHVAAADPQSVPWRRRSSQRADVTRPPDERAPAWPGMRSRRRRRRWVAGGTAVGFSVALVGLMGALGGASAVDDELPTVVVPEPEVATVEHDRSTGNLPFGEPVSVLNISDTTGGPGGP